MEFNNFCDGVQSIFIRITLWINPGTTKNNEIKINEKN